MKPLRVLASAPSLLIAAFLLAGCASSVPGGDTVPRTSELPGSAKPEGIEQAGTKPDLPKPTREQIAEAQAEGLTPPHMIGRDITRAAVLLPFSHPNRQVRDEAQGMLAGIEMALFELASDDFLIIPKDTAGTVAGAETAAKEAIVAGADVVLGPLFSQNVRSVAPISFTQNAPVIAFSNDPTAAGGGAYLASFTVEEEVARVVEYATFQGIEAFAYLGPDSAYGRRVESALRQHSAANGAYVLATQFYDPSNAAPVDEAQAIANILGPMVEDNPGKVGVMIPESGVKLRSVAPLLPYYGVDFRNLRMLGTSQWDDPSIWREPTLNGAWFAVPDDERVADFDARYRRVYGVAPSSLASLGFDAAAVAIDLKRRNRLDYGGITNPQGFLGANGLFRFRGDGTPERSLAIMEIDTRDGAEIVSRAASTFTPAIN